MKRFAPIAGWSALASGFCALLFYIVFPQSRAPLYTLAAIFSINAAFFFVADWDSIKRVLSGRAARYGLNSSILAAVFLGILIFVNLISYRHKYRVDMTEKGYYTLSPQTKKIVGSLPREVKMTAFFQTDSPNKADFQHLADGYVELTDKIKLEFVDPDKNPAVAKRYGVTTYGTVVLESGKQESKVSHATEENLTNGILKAIDDERKTIYFLDGHGERDLDNMEKEGYSEVKKSLEKDNFLVKKLLLMQSGEVPKDASLLIVNGPQKPILDKERAVIQDYLDQGGSVFLLIDPQSDSGMDAFLKKWGIEAGDDMVIDPLSKLFGGDFAAPVISQYTHHDITKDFALATIFPLARSVKAVPAEGVETVELLKTGPNSWGEKDLTGSKVKYDEGVDLKGPVAVAVVATRKIKDAGAASKNKTPAADEKGPKNNASGKNDDAAGAGKPRKATLVVVGDSDFASNAYHGFSGNGDFFLNTASFLAQEEKLISIRPRERKTSPVQLTRAEGSLMFILGMIVIPALVIGSGIRVWWRRRAL
ncbi:MAG: GldG family protein [Nitrospinae bacterium]|nr:GldG family protein [Nitrospinota bacterium]